MSDQIQEIKSKLDIIDVARSYLPSLKKGGKNYFALCPFHSEKTPSFSLNQDLQLYKCFGCGESGDVLNLIQKIENVDFPVALEIAAKRAGVELKKNYDPATSAKINERKRLIELNTLVAEYYNFILTKHPSGKRGQEYAKKRGLSSKAVKEFQIGYAPESFENLKNFLIAKKYKTDELLKGGVLVEKNGRVYDKFRDRLIFPIIDHRGDVVGFSGRAISDDDMPKYLNSPETEVFQKSKILYGLYQNRNSIRQNDNAILVEGQLDIISSWQIGIDNLIAPQGTALTDDQLKLLRRYTSNVTFCFDNDIAGEKALIRSSIMAHKQELNVKAVSISEGKDIDDLARSDPKELKNRIKKQENIVEHIGKRLEKRLDLTKVKAKLEALEILIPVISTLTTKVERDDYIRRISSWLNIDEGILIENLSKQVQETSYIAQARTIINESEKSPTREKEKYLITILLQFKDYAPQLLSIYRPTFFNTASLSNLYEKAKDHILKNKKLDLKLFEESLADHEKKLIEELLMKEIQIPDDAETVESEVKNVGRQLEKHYYKKQIMLLKQKSSTDQENVEVAQELTELVKKLRALE